MVHLTPTYEPKDIPPSDEMYCTSNMRETMEEWGLIDVETDLQHKDHTKSHLEDLALARTPGAEQDQFRAVIAARNVGKIQST